jgi:spoIIIJ-associated protein
MEWIEIEANTVDEAIAHALKELELSSKDEAVIEVIREGKSGFIGLGRQMAVVKVSKASAQRGRRRRRGRGGKGGNNKEAQASSDNGGQQRSKDSKTANKGGSRGRSGNGNRRPTSERAPQKERSEPRSTERNGNKDDDRSKAASLLAEQTEVATDFLRGLLKAFGLEGTVETRNEKDALYIDIEGDQTEALVGPKGTVLQAIHELTRTVVQRKTFGAPRIRLDIAGYAARRRQALQIYSSQLAEKVVTESEEVMLEPMNAADRKVVHDAIGDIDGVRSFSEGQEPHRSVVIAPAE